MKIIAQRGPRVFLLVGDHPLMARVLDLDQGILFPYFNVHSILARGYWEEFEGDPSILPELVKQVVIKGVKVRLHDIESGSLLVTMHYSPETGISLEDHPNGTPTVNPGMAEDFFDDMRDWTELVPRQICHHGRELTFADGDEFLMALCNSQPSNIVCFILDLE